MSEKIVFFYIDPEDVSFALIKHGLEPCEEFCRQIFNKLDRLPIYQMASQEQDHQQQEYLVQQEIWKQIQHFPEIVALSTNTMKNKPKFMKP